MTSEQTGYSVLPHKLRLALPATVRPSLALYNTRDNIDALAGAMQDGRKVFA